VVVDLAQLGELQSMAGQVGAVRSIVQGFGDPARLAGDPGALRGLAASHRGVASGLLVTAEQGAGQVGALTESWQGMTGEAFSGFWARVDGQVRDLASRHERMAAALDGAAARAESLNQQVTDVLGAVETWLGAAATAVATLDIAAVPGLLSAASGILSRWRALLPDLESFASGLSGQLEIDLGVSLPSPWPLPVDGVPPPDVGLPGWPRILITTPGPSGPGPLITTPGAELPGIPGILVPGQGGLRLNSEGDGEPSPPPDEPNPPPEEPPTLPKPPWAPPDSVWRGPGPEGSEQGGWFDPESGEWVHPHPDSPDHDPHYDVGQRGQPGYRRVYPDGRPDEVVA
jgi:uncharacterized protein YukE